MSLFIRIFARTALKNPILNHPKNIVWRSKQIVPINKYYRDFSLSKGHQSIASNSPKTIFDFECCYSYVSYRFQENPPQKVSDWEGLFNDITETLPAKKTIVPEDDIYNFDDLSDRKKNMLVTKTAKQMSNVLLPHNREYFVLNVCNKLNNLDAALSLIKYNREQNVVTNPTGEKLVLALISRMPDLSESQEQESLQLLDDVEKNRLDKDLFWPFVGALGNTSQWRRAFDIWKEKWNVMLEMEHMGSVRPLSVLIKTALKSKDFDAALEVMNHSTFHLNFSSLRENLSPLVDEVVLEWVKSCSEVHEKAKRIELLETIFEYSRTIVHFITPDIAKELESIKDENFQSLAFSRINQKSICSQCNSILPETKPSREDVEQLKELVNQRLVLGQDLHRRTNPKEFERFQKFLDETEPYDVVVDGLNVMFAMSNKAKQMKKRPDANPKTKGAMLANVLHDLNKRDLRILVITRKHTQKYPHMMSLNRIAQFIFLENVSEDDPFVILAALHMGPDTLLVSNDLFRQHVFTLRDQDVRRKFNAWQIRNQIRHELKNSELKLKWPPRYEVKAGKCDDYWHLPIANPEAPEGYHNEMLPPNRWLCLKVK